MNVEVLSLLDLKINQLKEEINQLDLFDDVFGLEEDEVIQRKALTADLF